MSKQKGVLKRSSSLNTPTPHTKPKRPPETVLAVFPDSKEGKKAFKALQDAAAQLKQTKIECLPFEKLDFGETWALEKFYSAPVVVVDVTLRKYEACLFYQLGLRESFGMKHNVVTCVDQESSYNAGRKGSIITDQLSGTSNFGVSQIPL